LAIVYLFANSNFGSSWHVHDYAESWHNHDYSELLGILDFADSRHGHDYADSWHVHDYAESWHDHGTNSHTHSAEEITIGLWNNSLQSKIDQIDRKIDNKADNHHSHYEYANFTHTHY